MPALLITDSTIVTSLDFVTVFDTITAKVTVEMLPTQWAAGGNTKPLGAKLIIVSPSGKVVSNGSTYAFTPPMSGKATFDLPKVNGAIEWGTYQIRLTLHETATKTYKVEKTLNLCPPEAGIPFRMDTNCESLHLVLYGGDGVKYAGVDALSLVKNFSFFYPSDSEETTNPAAITQTPTLLKLYSGTNRVEGTVDATFALPDKFTVIVRFSGSMEKYVQCGFPCFLWCAYKDLIVKLENGDCLSKDYANDYKRLMDAQFYLTGLLLGHRCGKDVDFFIQRLKVILQAEEHPCGDEEVVQLSATAAPPTISPIPPVPSANPDISDMEIQIN